MVTIERNNTSFTKVVLENLKKASRDFVSVEGPEWKTLKYYQFIIKEYFKYNTGSRGLLVALPMGMGKTRTGVALSMDAIQDGREVVFLAAKSLHDNFQTEIIKFVRAWSEADPGFKLGELSESDLLAWIKRNYHFISMNASNMITQIYNIGRDRHDRALDKKFKGVVSLENLDGRMLVVDEAHNFFRAVTNGSENALALYDMIMRSKSAKIVFLTGTPIANDPFELAIAYNCLAGRPGQLVLPDDYKTFNEYFVQVVDGIPSIKNRHIFQNRILGLTSYVRHDTPFGSSIEGFSLGSARAVEFPKELPMIVEKVPMTQAQYAAYSLARDKEKEEGNRSGPRRDTGIVLAAQKPKSGASSSYRVKSRQISNVLLPPKLAEMKYSDVDPNSLDRIQSVKIDRLWKNLQKSPGIALIYSQFVGVGGLGAITKFLRDAGYTEHKIAPAVIRGSRDRTGFILEAFPASKIDEFPLVQEFIGEIRDYPEGVVIKYALLGGEVRAVSIETQDEVLDVIIDGDLDKNVITGITAEFAQMDKIASDMPIEVSEAAGGADPAPLAIKWTEPAPKVPAGYANYTIYADEDNFVMRDDRGNNVSRIKFKHDGQQIHIIDYSSNASPIMSHFFVNKFKTRFGPNIAGVENLPSGVRKWFPKCAKCVAGGCQSCGKCTGAGNKCIVGGCQYCKGNVKKAVIGGNRDPMGIDVDRLYKVVSGNHKLKVARGFFDDHFTTPRFEVNGDWVSGADIMKHRNKYGDIYDRCMSVDLMRPIVLAPDDTIVAGYEQLVKCHVTDCKHLLYVNASDEQIELAREPTKESVKSQSKSKKQGGQQNTDKSTGAGRRTYVVISGEIDVSVRAEVQRALNAPTNTRGEEIPIILVSSTGAEGLDLKNVRQVHIFEPYWNDGRHAQVKARAVRNDSHIALPPADRNVQTYIYLAVAPDKPDEVTTDVELYTDSIKNKKIINDFIDAIHETTIECNLNGGVGCRNCNPTNSPLWSNDLAADVIRGDTCQPYSESKVKAKVVNVNGVDYYYSRGGNGDIIVYQYDEVLDGWRPIPVDEPLYDEIVAQIK